MKMRVTPFRAEGSLRAQPSKSAAHRLLICAALSDRETEIVLPSMNADMEATVTCLSALGARFQRTGECVRVIPVAEKIPCPHLNCGESGSTLRFLLPVAAALSGASFTGRGRLPQRPLSDLTEELTAHGVSVSGDRLPLQVSGGLLGASCGPLLGGGPFSDSPGGPFADGPGGMIQARKSSSKRNKIIVLISFYASEIKRYKRGNNKPGNKPGFISQS